MNTENTGNICQIWINGGGLLHHGVHLTMIILRALPLFPPRVASTALTASVATVFAQFVSFLLQSLNQRMINDGWIVKCDIHKYFYIIDHEIMKDVLDYYFDDDFTVWLNHLFIDSTGNPGLPLGNQVNQKYALLLLHSLDQMITIEFGNPYYGRYNDDFYVICKTKEDAREILEAIRKMVESLRLELNPKSQIVPFRMGLCYLGFHHYVTDKGKYIRKLRGDKKRKTQRKIRRWVRAVNDGKMSIEKFHEKYGSCKNHMLHGNCIKLCHSMDLDIERRMK